MSYVVVVLLSVLWLAFFLPSLLAARRTSSPLASAETFRHSLASLAESPATPTRGGDRPPLRHRRTAGRRRAVFAGLLVTSVAAAAVGATVGGAAWVAPAVTVAALCGYVALLRRQALRRRSRQVRVSAVARGVPTTRRAGEPAAVIPSVGRRLDAAERLERIAG